MQLTVWPSYVVVPSALQMIGLVGESVSDGATLVVGWAVVGSDVGAPQPHPAQSQLYVLPNTAQAVPNDDQ